MVRLAIKRTKRSVRTCGVKMVAVKMVTYSDYSQTLVRGADMKFTIIIINYLKETESEKK